MNLKIADETKEEAMKQLLFVRLVMLFLHFGKHVRIVLVPLAMIALAARSASADVVLKFLELPNEGGIHLTGTDSGGNVIDVTLLGSETFRVSAPGCTMIPGCNPNFTTNEIGTQTEFLVNILESPGGALSDQIHVHRLTSAGGSQVVDFISDDGTPFDTAGPGAIVTTLVETASLQGGLAYTSDAGTPVNISFISDVAEVPEPATLPVLGIGIGAVLALLCRKSW